MNAGRAITRAARAQRKKDIDDLARWCIWHPNGYGQKAYHALQAYWWWGWDINGHGGLGKPGADL